MNALDDVKDYDPRKSIGFLVNRLRAEMFAAIDRELARDQDLAAHEISAPQYIILSSLLRDDIDSTKRLCKEMSYDPGAMTRMLDRLEAKGLVRRKRCSDDRRLVNLELTESGLALVPKMRACAVAVLNRLLRDFTDAEAKQLEDFLHRLLRNA
jgi:DNA-binding MarR family transcriptional regulator